MKDVKSDHMSQYILTLIPSKAYDARYGSSVCGRFITRSDKGGFSGVAVYSCVYSAYTARVDTYKDGVKREGVFLLDGTDRDVSDAKADYARSLVSSLQILRGRRPLSRGEYDGDYYVDYTYDDTYDEIYDGGWFDEIVVTPDPIWDGVGADGLTNDEWMSSTTPDSTVDPSPEDDASNETEDVTSPSGETNEKEQEETKFPPVPFSEEEQKKVNALLNILEKNHKINPSKYTIMKANNCSVLARTEKNGIITLCNEFFNKPGLSDIDRLATIWHEMYHFDHKHYVPEYKSALFKSGPLELWRQNVPPEIKDFIEKQIESELRINLEELDGDMKSHYLNQIEATYRIWLTYSYYNTPPSFYENEINTHEAEKAEFPDSEVSDSYRKERDRLIWEYTEIQKEIQKESNN